MGRLQSLLPATVPMATQGSFACKVDPLVTAGVTEAPSVCGLGPDRPFLLAQRPMELRVLNALLLGLLQRAQGENKIFAETRALNHIGCERIPCRTLCVQLTI